MRSEYRCASNQLFLFRITVVAKCRQRRSDEDHIGHNALKSCRLRTCTVSCAVLGYVYYYKVKLTFRLLLNPPTDRKGLVCG